jgi:hypothetical protein
LLAREILCQLLSNKSNDFVRLNVSEHIHNEYLIRKNHINNFDVIAVKSTKYYNQSLVKLFLQTITVLNEDFRVFFCICAYVFIVIHVTLLNLVKNTFRSILKSI